MTTSQLYCTKQSTCPQAEKSYVWTQAIWMSMVQVPICCYEQDRFYKSKSDAAVFYRHSGKGFVIIAIAIDDLTMTATNDDIICEIKADLMEIFKMKDIGELHWRLNLKIE